MNQYATLENWNNSVNQYATLEDWNNSVNQYATHSFIVKNTKTS
jgi:hypothetical protein